MSLPLVAERLREVALRDPSRTALVWPTRRSTGGRWQFRSWTNADLERQSDQAAAGLRDLGVQRGTRVALFVPPGLEFFVLVFALFKTGAVMVCVDPGIGLRRLSSCLEAATPEWFLGSAKACAAQRLLRWTRRSIRQRVCTGASAVLWGARSFRSLLARGEAVLGSRPFDLETVSPEEPAAVLFTSGSTGAPKGVVYEHRHFAAQVDLLRDMFGIEPGEVDLSTFPLFGLFAPLLGMTALIPRMDFVRPKDVDPRMLHELITQFGVTQLFGSPAVLERVGRFFGEEGPRWPGLKRVVSAGAPVHAKLIERFARQLVAPAQVHTPYGATESLPVCSLASDEILRETRAATDAGKGLCVGRPVSGVEVRILRISDAPIACIADAVQLPTGGIGEIVVRGPSTTRVYDRLPQADAAAKISTDEGQGWHRMGDLGYFDAKGRLWFCGRMSQRVRTRDGDLYTIPCEAVFSSHPEVRRAALVGIPARGSVQSPVIWVEPELRLTRAEEARLRRELLDHARTFETTRAIRDLRFLRSFPVDIRHNAKIQREQLALLAERGAGEAAP